MELNKLEDDTLKVCDEVMSYFDGKATLTDDVVVQAKKLYYLVTRAEELAKRLRAIKSTEEINIPKHEGYNNMDFEDIYLFKVSDYETVLLGRYENGKFYVQRGDGTKYEYDEYRVVWARKIK